MARKNPSAAIDAFRQAFDGDPSAVFVLKVRNMQQAERLAGWATRTPAGSCRGCATTRGSGS